MAGGQEGVEHGPFPQNVARVKRLDTQRLTVGPNADPELKFDRTSCLVTGLYQCTGLVFYSVFQTESAPIFGWALPAESSYTLQLTATNNTDQSTEPTRMIWSEDVELGDATLDAVFSIGFSGVLNIGEPGPASFAWGFSDPHTLGGIVRKHSFVRLQLVR